MDDDIGIMLPPYDSHDPTGIGSTLQYDRLNEDGFTLIELAVVLMVIAILLAIAIPTLLGTAKAARDRGAQTNLNTALMTSNNVFQTNGQSFGIGTTAQYAQFGRNMASSLSSQQPGLAFTTSTSMSPSNISLSVSRGGNGIVLADRSPSGTCWYAIDNSRPISTINSANTKAPYGATPTTSPKTGTARALSLVFPTSVAGTWYAEVTGDTTAADCSASAPKLRGTSAKYRITPSAFPG